MTLQNIVIIVSLILAAGLLYIIFKNRRKPSRPYPSFTKNDLELLEKNVLFYRDLDQNKRTEFESRMHHFLSTTRITGVNATLEKLDELLIAASAIIPIFGFSNWEYMNLNEVLVYPDSFGEKFNQQGEDRLRAGVVGDGPYQNIMILSQPDLRAGFLHKGGTSNTGIHEFVHLVDKTDGAVDGVPESLLDHRYVLPWLNLVQKNIEEIKKSHSDIDAYGATNRAEFFAVVAEYFFKQPELLQEHHPELYELLTKIFRYKN